MSLALHHSTEYKRVNCHSWNCCTPPDPMCDMARLRVSTACFHVIALAVTVVFILLEFIKAIQTALYIP